MAQAATTDIRRPLTVADLNIEIDDEPRLQDVILGEGLGFSRPRAIRQIIDRNSLELQTYGGLPRRVANRSSRGGRPTEEAFLNEPQALLICMFSNTPRAAAVRKMLIDVFMEYRRGKLDKPVHVREHDRRTSTKVDDAVRLKKNIDRLESITDRIAPTQPNFCAMVIDGEPVFVDVSTFTGSGRAVVIGHDGRLRIEHVDPSDQSYRPFGARTALGERRPGQHGSTIRDSLIVVGKVMEPRSNTAYIDRQRVVDDVMDRLRIQITTLLDAGAYNDHQIARQLCCNPKLVREVRRVQSRKPTDTPPGRMIEHQPQYRGRRTIYRDEILRLLKTSLTNREIAQRTGATYQTVTHWRRWAADRP